LRKSQKILITQLLLSPEQSEDFYAPYITYGVNRKTKLLPASKQRCGMHRMSHAV